MQSTSSSLPAPGGRPAGWFVRGALGWLLVLPTVVAAALPGTAPATAGAAASLPAQIEPIPAGEVPLRADVDERFIQDVYRRARQKDPTATLAPQLETIARGISGLANSIRKDELRQLAVVQLESVAGHWNFYDRELARWRAELERVTEPYSDDAAALAGRRESWEVTAREMTDDGVANALRHRAAGILTQIASAEQALSGPLESQIRLGRRANTVQASIDAGRKATAAAIAHYDRRLYTIDAVPVWDAWQGTHFTPGEIRSTEAGLLSERAYLDEWSTANRERIVGYGLTMAVLLPLLMWLAWRSRDMPDSDPGVQAAARVLRRPLSAWLVLAFVGLPFFFPDSPLILHQAALLLALVPVLRLLPPQVFQWLGAWPYVTTVLFVVYRLSFLLLGQPLYYRLYLLVVDVVALGALAWLLRGSRHGATGGASPRLRAMIRGAGWLAVGVLLIGVVSNAIGNVTLAEVLGSAVLGSAYVGLALFAGVNVVTSLLNLLLARRPVSRFRAVTRHAGPLVASLERLLIVAALVVWVGFTLAELRAGRPVLGWLRRALTKPLEVGEISITLGSVLLFGFAVWVAFWVAKTVRLVLRDEVLPNLNLPRGVGNSIATLSYYALVIGGLMVALAAAGFQASQFALVFGALGVGIGFGLQDVVKNFVSGLILMFERPIQPGDVVEVSGTSGKVREIGMRATTLTTPEGADVIVPNGSLLSEKVVNWTLSDMNRRVDVDVSVGYGSDPRRVLALLEEVATGTPGIAPQPKPSVLFVRFGQDSIDFSIQSWTHEFADWVSIRTEMTARVHEALRREGIEMPFPQRDLHLRSVSPEAAAQLAVGVRRSAPDGA